MSGFDRSLKEFETMPDEPLGNGGLGRLAACFLDSAANLNVALDGYGIKYRFGLFKQEIENGFQIEKTDNYLLLHHPLQRDILSLLHDKYEKQTMMKN